ncbi:hypothetical protein HPB50_002790 [Hyalomma asiaticum]|uniref:Uncharacterized protein n=1 Tax=Hyalomma asiaticum TaxID=266040 RepID=A0ACB7S338_HYAAI|nr:hypothetical protein HPB50_002790 [Hyalomma asiaticum]
MVVGFVCVLAMRTSVSLFVSPAAASRGLVNHLLEDLPTRFVWPSVLKECNALLEVSYGAAENQKGDEDLVIGSMTHSIVEALSSKNKPSSTLTVMRELYQTQGLRSLFAGIVPRVSKVAPACAIMISTYEFGKKFFRQKNAARAGSTGSSL